MLSAKDGSTGLTDQGWPFEALAMMVGHAQEREVAALAANTCLMVRRPRSRAAAHGFNENSTGRRRRVAPGVGSGVIKGVGGSGGRQSGAMTEQGLNE